MVIGHLGGIHAVLAVVLTARQEFHFLSIFRMILQILEEFGKGGVEDSQRNADGSHKYYGRFNQGVVTINLVDVACSSEGDMDRFWAILDERLELCHEALRCRRCV